MANYTDPAVKAEQKIEITISMDKEIKQEPTYAEDCCVGNFMESDCVLGVDAVEREVLIDGRDMQNEESVGAGSIDAEHSEDERSDFGNPPTPKKRINKEKRKRHMSSIQQAQFEDHHYTSKRKRGEDGKEMMSSQLTIEDAKTDSENDSFKCGICDRTFSQKVFLNRHLMIHTGEKPYECVICNQRFNQKVNLNRHILIHTGEKPFKCDICNVEFSQKVNLNRHLKTHTGEKPFRCKVCKFECNQKVNLQRHLKTHNPLEELSDDLMVYVKNEQIYVAKLY